MSDDYETYDDTPEDPRCARAIELLHALVDAVDSFRENPDPLMRRLALMDIEEIQREVRSSRLLALFE